MVNKNGTGWGPDPEDTTPAKRAWYKKNKIKYEEDEETLKKYPEYKKGMKPGTRYKKGKSIYEVKGDPDEYDEITGPRTKKAFVKKMGGK